MKIKIKRVSKQALSVILAIMMLVSTMLIGTISVVAATYSNPVYNQQYLYVDLTDYTSGKTLKGINGYKDDDCSDDSNFWYANGAQTSDSENVYKLDLAKASYANGNANADVSADDYKNFRSFTIVLDGTGGETRLNIGSNGTNNCYKVNSDATGGTWKNYPDGGGSGETKSWDSVTLIGGTLNDTSIGGWGDNDDKYPFTYNPADDTWYSEEITFTGGTNEFKARVNKSWSSPSFGDGKLKEDGQEDNFTETLNGTYIFYVKDGAAIGTNALQYKTKPSGSQCTVKSKLNVTNDTTGASLLTATTDGTETTATVTGSTCTLTASASKTNYNFAGWQLEGVTLTSGTTASETISFTVNSDAENPTVTATAITLTPRLDVSTTSLVLNETKNESVTLHAYSKAGDKTKKAKYYTVTYYYDFTSEDGNTTTAKNEIIKKEITVTDEDYANMSSADVSKYLIGGIHDADYTFTPTARGTYVFYADIQGYDAQNGNLVTGEYAELSLGTSLGKDGGSATVTVTDGTFKLPIADSDDNRLFAYATTLADGETPNADAWVAADSNTKQAIYGQKEEQNGAVVAYPSIGSASASSFNIYLPSSASNTEVVLYNNYTDSVTITGSDNKTYTISKGNYASVPYTSGSALSYTVSGSTKSITVYRSTAEGALYLNNTADFSSNSDVTDTSVIDSSDNVPNMIKQLYSNKETGAVSGCSGATALGSNIDYVNIKKIKGRGNTTWSYTDKKSFNVTFSSDLVGTTFGDKFEFNGAKYSLLANYKDPSLARNEILYTLADEMGVTYSPNTAVIDLYMNGLYMGTYLMTEKIEVGKKELINNISDSLYKDDTISANGFSFLMELDTNANPDDYSFAAEGDQVLTIKEPEVGTDFTTNYIKARYKELIDALNDQSMTMEELNKIIDVNSLAKFFLLNELAKNCDIGVSSTYFVYKYDAVSNAGKFYASPVWDLDMTVANGEKGSEYVKYTGNWSYQNNNLNRVIKAAFNNSNVQAAARSIWTEQYGLNLIETINKLGSDAYTKIGSSYTMNFTKWDKPYGFNGGYDDKIAARTELKKATYTAENGYSEASSATGYNEDAGQINFVTDWLTSRAAWMTQKYNTYYVTGNFNDWNWNETGSVMSNTQNGVNTLEIELAQGIYEFKISSDGGAEAYRSASAYSISFSPDMLTTTNYKSTSDKITELSINTALYEDKPQNNFKFKTTEAMKVYITYDQKANTVTLSDQLSTTTNLDVTLTGSEVQSENIVEGTPVTLIATVTPAMKDNAVLAGTYTVELFRDGTKLETQMVIFGTSDLNKTVEFSTKLAGKSQTYTVNVSYTDGELTTYTDTASKTYKQTGLKDKKIYFDPSTIYDSSKNQVWKSQMTPESTVTAYIKNNAGTQVATFTMVVDTEDIHGYDKGVFVANIDDETLALLQDSTNTVVFKMVGTDNKTYSTCKAENDNEVCSHEVEIKGDEHIQSGWIYNYSNEKSEQGKVQWRWEEYNVAYEVGYPLPEITTYDEFKDYLADQANKESPNYNKDNIVYFDNSASKWYNVYIYGWADPINDEYGHLMKKLPYGDIWYYDFGETKPTSSFLFKDRGDYGFGSDYQQTVDLVDGTIKNGNNEDVTLKFANTIGKANPIFITNTFYKSSQQNGGGALKFRAFNTEWKEFATVVASKVQLKAVDIYFDLHTKDATDIELYREATCSPDDYKFPSDFVRLTQLPDSTIYYTKVMLPYSKANGCEFKFTKFLVNINGEKKEYAMGAASQPKDTCISTGEVWYEVNANYKNGVSGDSLDALSADYSIVSNKSAVDTSSSVGAAADNNAVGANSYTIYVIPDKLGWADYVDSTTGEIKNLPANQSLLARVNYGTETDDKGWASIVFDKDSRTIDGKAVYSVTLSLEDPGLRNLYIKIANPSNDETTMYTQVFGSFTNYGNFSNKVYNGTSLVDPQWDTVSTNWYLGGYVNETSLGFADINYQFTPDGNNIYKLNNVTFTTNTQYLVVNDGTTTYLSNGNTSTEPNPFDNKWQVDSSTAKTFDFTWNATTKTLTWEVVPETSHTITNNATGVTVNTPASVGTIVTIKPTDSSKKITAVTLSVDAEITYNANGTATFVMPDLDVTINSVTLVDKVVTPSVEYCAILSYNHSTATFTSKEGGTITDAYVNLIHGNYQDEAIPTGYRTSDNGIYTVIYALPSSAANGPTTSNVSVVKDNDTSDKLKFAGWTRDGQAFGQDQLTMEDKVIGASATNYLANFSEREQTTYTFNYNYMAYNSANSGMEYNPDADLEEKTYSVNVIFYKDATGEELLAAYKANQPTLVSDYFTYTFDNVNVDTLNREGTTVSADADYTVRTYKVFCNNVDGSNLSFNEYHYQNIATVTIPDGVKPEGTKTVWKDENGKVLYIGDSYRIRVTNDGVTLVYSFEPEASIPLSTYVNDPTYEFFTTDQNVEKVRFNILVDNFIGDKNVSEYGVVYFFTDKDGKPVNESVAHDANITADMIKELMTAENSPVKTYKFPMELVNSDKKYIFASTLTNNAANKDRYLRVFSYFKYKENGVDQIVVSEKSVLASISNAK